MTTDKATAREIQAYQEGTYDAYKLICHYIKKAYSRDEILQSLEALMLELQASQDKKNVADNFL